MSKKLLTIFSLLLIFFAMSCNNKSTDPTAPLKDSQYVGKWYEEISNDPVIEIKQDGSIDLLDKTVVLVSASGTDVIKEGNATFKTTFSKEGQTAEIVLTFTNSTTGSMLLDKDNTITIVKK